MTLARRQLSGPRRGKQDRKLWSPWTASFAAFLVILGGAGIAYHWYTSTPRYAVERFIMLYNRHDYDQIYEMSDADYQQRLSRDDNRKFLTDLSQWMPRSVRYKELIDTDISEEKSGLLNFDGFHTSQKQFIPAGWFGLGIYQNSQGRWQINPHNSLKPFFLVAYKAQGLSDYETLWRKYSAR